MIYKFKSKATGDLIMLEESGRAILAIIGKSDPQSLRQGILQVMQMPDAIAALHAAVLEEEGRLQERATAARQAGLAQPTGGQGVSLRQRSLPFIRMLERCQAEKKDIVWGV